MDGCQSCVRYLLSPRTDATEMSRIADRHGTQAGLPRFGNREVHRFATDHLTIAELPVDDGIARTFTDDHRMLVGDYHALRVPIDVLGHANDAMRFVSGKICVDQVIGDEPRFAVR